MDGKHSWFLEANEALGRGVLYFKCMFDIGIQPPSIHSIQPHVKSFVPESQRTDSPSI